MLLDGTMRYMTLARQCMPKTGALWSGINRKNRQNPWAQTGAAAKPSEEEIRHQVDRVIESPAFQTSQRNRRFLRYVVEETLAGRAERIKAYSVATVVFERGADFDPQIDPIIRIEATRLRRALDHYYLGAGRLDPVRIVVPKGSYVPAFDYAAPGSDAPVDGQRGPATAEMVKRLPMLVAIGLGLVVVVGVGGYLTGDMLERLQSGPPRVPDGQGVSLSVLPFDVPGNPLLGERLAHDVEAGLTQFPDLFIFTPQHGGARQPTDYVVSARGELVDDRLQLLVGLTDARSGQQLWSAKFAAVAAAPGHTPPTENTTRKIVRTIAGPRGAIVAQQAKIVSRPSTTLTPYQCVLKYQLYWRHPASSQLAETRKCLEHAVKTEPGYASAHASLALAQLDRIRFRELPRREWRPVLDTALTSARLAIDLAPNNPRGYQALQHVKWLQGEVEQSFAAGERALALNQNDLEIMAELGFRYGLRGEWTKAMPLLEEAFGQDPDLPSMYRQVTSLHHYVTGRYDEALAEALRIDLPNYVYAHALRAIAYARLNHPEKARASVERILALEPHFPETVIGDLQARNVHPALIRVIVDGLRAAGLETIAGAGG